MMPTTQSTNRPNAACATRDIIPERQVTFVYSACCPATRAAIWYGMWTLCHTTEINDAVNT